MRRPATLVVIAAAVLAAPASTFAQGARPARPAPRTPPLRFITLTVGGHLAPPARADAGTPEIYVEPAVVRTTYRAGVGPALDVGAGFRIRGRLGAAASVGMSRTRGNIIVDASIPSPVLFERHRQASASDRARRSTIDIDVDAWWLLRDRRRFWLAVGGGMSITRVSQELDTDLRLDDRFPFDTVSIRDIVLSRHRATAAGGSVVARSAWMLGRRVGLEADVRWRALAPAVSDAGRRVEIPAGGLRAGGGLHIRF